MIKYFSNTFWKQYIDFINASCYIVFQMAYHCFHRVRGSRNQHNRVIEMRPRAVTQLSVSIFDSGCVQH